MYSPRQSTPESKIPGHTLHTPPYTPIFTKQRFSRADSPASIMSIHPTETASPAKKDGHQETEDGVKVEELTEADAGYIADVDVVYPEELEEPESESEQIISSSTDDSDMDITQPFSRLDCIDGAEMEFEKKRRAKHVRKRTNSRVFKRSHSTSVKSDTEMTDSDALGDQDRPGSARRLRRRTREFSGVQVVYEEAARASPSARPQTMPGSVGDSRAENPGRDTDASSTPNAMDVDDSG